MGTLNAFYVRAPDPSAQAAIRTAYPIAFAESGSEFFAIEQPKDRYECPKSELRSLSERLNTEVVWLSFQSVVDAFQYHHWNCGEHLRSLVYGCFEDEREWEEVEGHPQPWEAEVLFGDLSRAVSFCNNETERRRIELIYRNRNIEPGAIEPSLDARETARGVAQYYRFPGWHIVAKPGVE